MGSTIETGMPLDDGDLTSRAKLRALFAEAIADIEGLQNTTLRAVTNVVTLAEINAGKIIVPAVAGVTLTPVFFIARVAGTFAVGTSVELEDTNGTPVVVASLAVAQLSNGAVLFPGETGVTLGAGFGVGLTAGKGLAVTATGTHTTATSITFTVAYLAVEA